MLSLARMELENFFKNVMPVADYFDQSDMLVTVSFALILLNKLKSKAIVMRRLMVNEHRAKFIKIFEHPFWTFYKRRKIKKQF